MSQKIFVREGEQIPKIEQGNYLVKLNDGKIIISPLPSKIILKKIEDFSYLLNGVSKKIYDSEKKIALKKFVIEEFVK